MTDFLDKKRGEIEARLKELKPLVDEYQRLEAAVAALKGVGASPAAPARRGPGRPRGSAAKASAKKPRSRAKAPAAGKRRAGRRKGSGTRAVEAEKFVREQPGITIPELAAKMGIKQNYLYRVLPGLEADGKVVKQGRGWNPRGS